MAVASIFIALLGAGAWLNRDLFEAHRVASAFIAGADGGASTGKAPLSCPGSGVVPAALEHAAIGEVDWDMGFRAIRTRDGRERLSRHGLLRDTGTGQERWFKLTLQREGDGPWCVLAFSVDKAPK